MYFILIKKRLIIYLLAGIMLAILVGINTVVVYEIKVLKEYTQVLQVIAGKRQHMLREIQRINRNIERAATIVPVNVNPEDMILSRIDLIRLLPGVKIHLETFMKDKENLMLPITITYSSDDFLKVVKLLHSLRFRSYPLFYYKNIYIGIDKGRNRLECKIKGYIFTPLLRAQEGE